MRIIAGSRRGRRLSGLQGAELRPTSDKVREALFSILGNRVVGAAFLDLYAGTGAVGLEALSRGAVTATFVECDTVAIKVLRQNLHSCKLLDEADIRNARTDVFLNRQDWWRGPYHIIFADPPYAASHEVTCLKHMGRSGLLAQDGVIVLEHSSRIAEAPTFDQVVFLRRYDYGDTSLFLYSTSGSDRGSHS